MRRGVPAAAVTTEVDAGNTLENVRVGMSALAAAGQKPRLPGPKRPAAAAAS